MLAPCSSEGKRNFSPTNDDDDGTVEFPGNHPSISSLDSSIIRAFIKASLVEAAAAAAAW